MINGPTDSRGMFDYAWSHAIISDQLYYNLVKECDFENENNQTEHCNDHMRAFLQAFSDIDIYGIYAPVCLSSSSSSSSNPNKVKASTYNSIKLLVAPRLLTQHVITKSPPSQLYLII